MLANQEHRLAQGGNLIVKWRRRERKASDSNPKLYGIVLGFRSQYLYISDVTFSVRTQKLIRKIHEQEFNQNSRNMVSKASRDD